MVKMKTTCNIESSKVRSRNHRQGTKQLSATTGHEKARSRNQNETIQQVSAGRSIHGDRNLISMVKLLKAAAKPNLAETSNARPKNHSERTEQLSAENHNVMRRKSNVVGTSKTRPMNHSERIEQLSAEKLNGGLSKAHPGSHSHILEQLSDNEDVQLNEMYRLLTEREPNAAAKKPNLTLL